jgi:hypothetical protein
MGFPPEQTIVLTGFQALFYELANSLLILFPVIPAQAGIRKFQTVYKNPGYPLPHLRAVALWRASVGMTSFCDPFCGHKKTCR